MEALAAQLEAVSDWITLHITMWVLVGTGILLTVLTRGVQLRRLPDMLHQVGRITFRRTGRHLLLPGLHDLPGRPCGHR